MKFKFVDQNDEVISEYEFNPSQERFFTSPKKFVLFSGGYGCGKSLALTLKAIDLSLRYPYNFILMGRKTYPELRDTLWKEFFVICPQHLIASVQKAEMKITFINGSEIIFRHLDTVAESEIRSLNLGAAFIDQAEDISKEVVMGLRGRLRREGVEDKDRKIYLSCNPALTWLFKEFKLEPKKEYEVIEASTLENRAHLPAGYIEDLLKYPESYRRQYVYGVWDESLMSDNVVFAREHQKKIWKHKSEPIKTVDGLNIYAPYKKGHRYQMGIDPNEGSEGDAEDKDFAALTIVDLTMLEEVAEWHGKEVAPDILGEKAVRFARMYQDPDGDDRCLIIPEMNAIGLALINKLREYEEYIEIYRREDIDRITKQKLMKHGWRTTRKTKPLLIARFQELLRLCNPKIHSERKIDQMKSFVYTDVVNRMGMGAKQGFHDDDLISLFLAFWEKGTVEPTTFTQNQNAVDISRFVGEDIRPKLRIINGKARISGLVPIAGRQKRWTVV